VATVLEAVYDPVYGLSNVGNFSLDGPSYFLIRGIDHAEHLLG
jgi:hypothetical protein